MSVKDQLEQSHIDGSHTTVRSRKSTASSVVSKFNKEAAWQQENYGNYQGVWLCCTFALFVHVALQSLKRSCLARTSV
jgi:hypothetical protein